MRLMVEVVMGIVVQRWFLAHGGRAVGLFIVLTASVFASGASTGADTLHIALHGDDSNRGSLDAPIRSLEEASRRLFEEPDIGEVVLHEGTYRGSLSVPVPDSAEPQAIPPLLVRAADGDRVVIDGARLFTTENDATPLDDVSGVYGLRLPTGFWSNEDEIAGRYPSIWDRRARKRYLLAADLYAVKQFQAAFTLNDDTIYLHTHDGQPLSIHEIEISRVSGVNDHGVIIHRPGTTVRGLNVQGFFKNPVYSSGFMVYGEGSVIEDCTVTNCPRGFSIGGENVTVRHCSAEDVGGGVRCSSARPRIEDNVFTKVRDGFEILLPPVQEDAGVLMYYATQDQAAIRGNVIRGFDSGVYLKCHPGTYTIESNTFVEISSRAIGGDLLSEPGSTVLSRRNLVYGSTGPIGIPLPGTSHLTAEDNCLAPSPWMNAGSLLRNVKDLNARGKGNFLADPRLAAPGLGDFRLLPDSPCLAGVRASQRVGARGHVEPDFADKSPPLLSLSEQPYLTRLSEGLWFAAHDESATVLIAAHDNMGRPHRMKVRVGAQEWSEPVKITSQYKVSLPSNREATAFSVRVSDKAGNWTEPATIHIRSGNTVPRLTGEPVVRTNAYGAIISFQTDVECTATGIYDASYPLRTRYYENDDKSYRYYGEGTSESPRRDHVLTLVLKEPDPDRELSYRLDLTDLLGRSPQGRMRTLRLSGEPRVWYVAPHGRDAETGGTATQPVETLQYAVDRALPGDRIDVAPGVYSGSTVLTHGGAKGAPLVIRSTQKLAAALDGQRQVRSLITLVQAPYVKIRDFEMRWFSSAGTYGAIYAFRSSDVTVSGCKIWNSFWWRKRPQGRGLVAAYSPGFTAEWNLIFTVDYVMKLYHSPRSLILHNTTTASSHTGIDIDESATSTTVKNNDLAFQGNDVMAVRVTSMKDLETFDCDYNNLGTSLREWQPSAGAAPNLSSPEANSHSKAVVIFYLLGGTWESGVGGYPNAKWSANSSTPPERRGDPYLRLRTIEDWREFSGKDRNSLFVDPLRESMSRLWFDLDPQSPLLGAGEQGATIGAMGVR